MDVETIDLTIILPTRNEAANVVPLVAAIGTALATGRYPYELLFVDDSTDNTPQVINSVKARAAIPIRLHHRPEKDRDGLSGAVVAGLKRARGRWALVMDADLQHPPSLIPQMLDRAAATEADVVVASRQGSVTGPLGLSPGRALTSQGLTVLARALFPNLLRNASDPLTGFFLVRRDHIDLAALRPDGFKILLEILIRCPTLRVTELHFPFGQRHGGESKADVREGLRFFRHLLRLRLSANPSINRVIVIVLLGFVLDVGLFWLIRAQTNLSILFAAIISAHGAMLFHLVIAGQFGVLDLPGGQGLVPGVIRRFFLRNEAMLLLRLPLLWVVASRFSIPSLLAHISTLLVVAGLRYLLSDRWIWTKHSIPASPHYHHYDIHGILHLESTVALPALAYFYVADCDRPVDIRLQIDRYGTPRCAAGSICYDERLGRLGFGVAINPGDTTEVTASALLEHSPDVLYTSIVEPLLRWAFVRRGYALLYGAGLARNGQAVFVHDPDSVGKTDLVLKAGLIGQSWQFLSDDMTILHQDGTLMSYPKPLIVKQAIMWAFTGTQPDSPLDRLWLVVQRNLYSPLAHWGGLLLYRLRLPAATINALTQRLIPPRRRDLQTIVPSMPIAKATPLRHIYCIEKGEPLVAAMTQQATEHMLLQSVDHAFVFPPYPELAQALRFWRGEDLLAREQAIVRQAIGSIQAQRIQGDRDSWWSIIDDAVGVTDPAG